MLAKLLFGVAPLGLVGLATAPAPKTTRYRIESKGEQVVDLSAVGQGKQTNTTTQIALLSITLSDTTGGQIMHVVVDSISMVSSAPEAAAAGAEAAKAKGAWVHGIIDQWGRGTVVATSAETNDAIAQLKTTLTRFFPVMKPGAKQGDSWVDTAQITTKTAAQAMKMNRLSTYTHGGSTQWGGAAATRIDAASTTSGAGTLENPMAGTMELEMTGTGTESFYLSSDGTYLGGEAKSSGDSKIRAAMLPDAIPVTTTTTTTVSVIK